jgi:Kef-type K+ transport system membrane component KefB
MTGLARSRPDREDAAPVILLLQIAIVLATARLARWLVMPLGQPPVIGEMAAGLLLGPSFLRWLMPDSSAALFPVPSLPALNALSQLGLVLFMFFLGVRVDAHKVDARRNVAMVTSVTSIIVPFALGAWLATGLHERLAPAGVGVLPFRTVFRCRHEHHRVSRTGADSVDQRLLRTEVGVMAIACAAFDDVTGWLILAGLTTLIRPDDVSYGFGVRLLFLIGYLAVMIGIVRPALRWFVNRRGRDGFGESADDLAVLLLVMLLSAVATEFVGVHALFGAFFAGLMMPRDAQIERAFEQRIEPLTMTLLLPLFFAFTGLRTNVQLLNSAAMWRDAALILLVAVFRKGGRVDDCRTDDGTQLARRQPAGCVDEYPWPRRAGGAQHRPRSGHPVTCGFFHAGADGSDHDVRDVTDSYERCGHANVASRPSRFAIMKCSSHGAIRHGEVSGGAVRQLVPHFLHRHER